MFFSIRICILWALALYLHNCGAFIRQTDRLRKYTSCTIIHAKKSIFGENIVTCRPFELKSPKSFEFIGSYKSFNEIPKFAVPEIAFIGRSNVGKSSLLNCLTGMHKSIAIVGKTPGTTQSVNIFKCGDNTGSICTFADLPGFGFAKLSRLQQDEISQVLKDYFSARGALKLVMLLVDPRREPSPADLDTFAFLVDRGVPVVVVATKVDKLNREETRLVAQRMQRSFAAAMPTEEDSAAEEGIMIEDAECEADTAASQLPVILFSSVTGLGKGDLWKAIRENIIS